MPLPDERPRQSVANLIGRFEQQGKRQPTPPLPGLATPRSSSVSSQITSDAAKEELKEKKEWPPKPAASADIESFAPTLSSLPTPTMSKSSVVSPQPIFEPAPSVDDTTTPTPASPEPVKSPPSKSKPIASGKSTTTVGTRLPVASPAKPRSSVANSSSVKSLAGSRSKTFLQSSVSQPIRPQHTGRSVTSNPSTTRQSRSVPRTAPSTPSRPKSSAAQNQAVPRPKTPSFGLFAPTASSLARSRNAPPPPPPPVRKVTLSSDAAERLSKPTAASLSKARAPATVTPASSPARMAKSTSTGAPSTAPKGPSKLKTGGIPTKKVATAKEEIKSDPASIFTQVAGDSDCFVADRAENGHVSGAAAFSDVGSPEDTPVQTGVVDVATHEPAAHEDVHHDSKVHPEQHASGHPVEDDTHSHEHAVVVDYTSPGKVAGEQAQVQAEAHENSVSNPTESHAGEVISNGNDHKVEPRARETDIEDIVNLLEGASKTRPQSIATIPDEIPGEY